MPQAQHYFDHNATTPPDPRVIEEMLPWLRDQHGNASSVHRAGQAARGAIEAARREVAKLLAAQPLEVVFLASGSEANNQVIASVLRQHELGASSAGIPLPPPRLVISAMEHPSIVAAAQRASDDERAEVVMVAPGPDGRVNVGDFEQAIAQDGRTVLVALMLANNELGTLQPVSEVSELCRQADVPLLCDAVQAAGKVAIDRDEIGADFLVIGGHKFHGPLGAAALCVRKGNEVEPLLVGGGQERRRRASTENVPAIVGLGAACRFARTELAARSEHLEALQRRFESAVCRQVPDVTVHCQTSARLPNTTNLRFEGVSAQDLLIRLDLQGFAVSTGSACASGTVEPSATLLAMGLSREQALATLRISFGMTNHAGEVDDFVEALAHHVAALRGAQIRAAESSAPQDARAQGTAAPARVTG